MDRLQKTSGTRVELQMARSMCWHCQSEVAGEYFCDRCVKVQPLSKELDYFTCLGLSRRLMIDPANLEKRFYELSRTFHPDFFQTKTESEQADAGSVARESPRGSARRRPLTNENPIQLFIATFARPPEAHAAPDDGEAPA